MIEYEDNFDVEKKDLVKIIDVNVYMTPPPYQIPVLQCELEDGRSFSLYQIPVDVMLGIIRLKGEDVYNERETLFELITLFREDFNVIRNKIEMIIIDELDKETNLYNAKIIIRGDGYKIMKKMVPSHAIYLAYLLEIPMYVKKELVDQQERQSENY
jgi:bifunctional DNase/RNase